MDKIETDLGNLEKRGSNDNFIAKEIPRFKLAINYRFSLNTLK